MKLRILCGLSLALMVGFTAGFIAASRGMDYNEASFRLKLTVAEAGITVFCLIAVYAIGMPVAARQEARRERRRHEGSDEDYDDEEHCDKQKVLILDQLPSAAETFKWPHSP